MPNNMNNFVDSLNKLNGHHDFLIGDLFNDDFMKRYTDFDDIESFMKETNISAEELKNYIDHAEKLDKIAQDFARFATFKDFIGQAAIDKQLSDDGFDVN